MRANRTYAICLAWSLLLAGCATPGSGDGLPAGDAEPAMSRQTPGSEAQRRSMLHVELGTMYFNVGRLEVALEEARIAIESDASYAPAHSLMGLIQMSLRQNERAEQSFRRALGLARGDPEINNDFGWFLCRTGRERESLAYFQAAFDNPLFQSPVRALTNAGVCAALAREDRRAEDYLLRALRKDRSNAIALLWLAEIALRGDRPADARQRIDALHALVEPNAESAWLGLRIERKLGNRSGEARYMGILRSRYPDSDEYVKMSRGEFE